ncbi:hypothetical protein EG68_07790 [Paragonimus skrjabini miyazakii]|uniref:Uncharacterized protein n=1 Tax=Paragonimus skrjabini miyazakii TaxID=59628 RepID=A0A8S9YPS9_9TREM|nr:hypothetical protein EG68_07790 [Paragonimus skrjabini miyazakii]
MSSLEDETIQGHELCGQMNRIEAQLARLTRISTDQTVVSSTGGSKCCELCKQSSTKLGFPITVCSKEDIAIQTNFHDSERHKRKQSHGFHTGCNLEQIVWPGTLWNQPSRNKSRSDSNIHRLASDPHGTVSFSESTETLTLELSLPCLTSGPGSSRYTSNISKRRRNLTNILMGDTIAQRYATKASKETKNPSETSDIDSDSSTATPDRFANNKELGNRREFIRSVPPIYCGSSPSTTRREGVARYVESSFETIYDGIFSQRISSARQACNSGREPNLSRRLEGQYI